MALVMQSVATDILSGRMCELHLRELHSFNGGSTTSGVYRSHHPSVVRHARSSHSSRNTQPSVLAVVAIMLLLLQLLVCYLLILILSFAPSFGSPLDCEHPSFSCCRVAVWLLLMSANARRVVVLLSTMLVQQRCWRLRFLHGFFKPHGYMVRLISTTHAAYQQRPCLCKASFLRPARGFRKRIHI